MAELADVRRIALALPQTRERTSRDGTLDWRVGDRLVVWERPLRRSDLATLGDAAPTGVVVAARVADEGVKSALIAAAPEVYFTTPHFDGYPAVLIRLAAIEVGELEELIIEAWLDRAPRRAVKAYLADSS
jgi:hypothetical protein